MPFIYKSCRSYSIMLTIVEGFSIMQQKWFHIFSRSHRSNMLLLTQCFFARCLLHSRWFILVMNLSESPNH